MNESILILIPARSGSKGVPNKNFKPLLGSPLIDYSINAALDAALTLSDAADCNVAVSSDSTEYLEFVKSRNVLTIKRPDELADDHTPMIRVVEHALDVMASNHNKYITTTILLQPTCPARQSNHICDAYSHFYGADTDSLVSVTRMEDTHPARMYEMDENGRGLTLSRQDERKNRQDLSPVFHRNGAIYIFSSKLVNQGKLISETPLLFAMEKKYSINIDDEIDWIFAEAICAFLQKG